MNSNRPPKQARRNSGVTDTPAFRRWFGDSKVVDADGKPLVVYHGGFDVTGSRTGVFRRSASGALGTGIYFTPDRSVAEYYTKNKGGYEPTEGGVVSEVYLSIVRPLIVTHGREYDPAVEALTLLGVARAKAETTVERARDRTGDVGKVVENAATKAGYDGIFHYIDGDLYEIVAFQPTQVKSATHNRGTFDWYDPDIRHNPRRARRNSGVTDTPAFHRWFGNSKVVDADGKPLPVYHGTFSDFSAFDYQKSRGINRLGFWFDAAVHIPNVFAGGKKIAAFGGSGSVVPVYLSLQKPKEYWSDPLTRDEYESLETLIWGAHRRLDGMDFPETPAEQIIRRDATKLGMRPVGLGDLGVRLHSVLAYLRIRGWRDAYTKMLRDLLPESETAKSLSWFLDNVALVEAARERLAKQHDGVILHSTLTDTDALPYVYWTHPDAYRTRETGAEVRHFGNDWYLALHPTQIKSVTGNRGTFDPADPDIRHNPRRARLNPDYPNVQVLKGRIVSPEGSIPVRKIGEGAFSTVYLSEEAKPRVFAVTSKRAKEKEILSQAYALDPKNPHLPQISRYGSTKTGKTVWTMPYYTMLGKAKEATEARNDAKALTACRTSTLKRKSFRPKTSDEINEAIVSCAEASVAVRPQLVRALDALRWAARLHETYLFEFQQRNLAVDAKGRLILLDVIFDWKA